LLKERGSYNLVQNMGHKGPVLRPTYIRPARARTQILFYSNTVSLQNVAYLNRLRWQLVEDFIELTNNNKNNTKMMTTNHWKSFTDRKEDKKKCRTVKITDSYLYLLFVIQT